MNHTYKRSKAPSKKRPVTLSVRRDLLDEAKALNVNASQAAENGILSAIREANERAWLEENADAIEHYNKAISKSGVFYTPDWVKSDGAV